MRDSANAEDAWPEDGLEEVPRCPVCKSGRREMLHEGLTDGVFFAAPGKWNLFRCVECGTGYLNPRPNLATIALAYQRYYTHSDEGYDLDSQPQGFVKRIRRALANGYRNHRYGTAHSPSTALGRLAMVFLRDHRRRLDLFMRHLPRAQAGNRLLDFGCGSGGFLVTARSAGWDVVGVDLDPRSVATARAKGIDVYQGGIEVLDSLGEEFAFITLNHVVEHVHDPIALLEACQRVLKPEGSLWLQTPNLNSLGHRRYGRHWRGLEAPRHLVLFTRRSLERCLHASGFEHIQDLPYVPDCAHTFRASKAVAAGQDPYEFGDENLTPDDIAVIKEADRRASRDPDLRESITVLAGKA